MGKLAKDIFDKAKEAGMVNEKSYLVLMHKVDGKPTYTGPHRIKVVSEARGTGTDPFTNQPREEFQMKVEESGVEKMWNLPLKDKEGKLHYAVQQLAEIDDGEEFTVEMRPKGLKSIIYITRDIKSADGVPVEQISIDDEEDIGEAPF